ncbi:MAG: hypothetical protein EOO73_16995 [Myxococcales bacterium]|nr:MAG: hypothetical protein EOO73_16995 [Myxococcales bacterium]
MTLLPGLCVECARVQLVPIDEARVRSCSCEKCGAPVRVVPGCSYAESEREHFRELCDIVGEAHVSAAEASSLAQELERATWKGSYLRLFDTLTARLPGLVPLQVSAGRNPAAQQRVLEMLRNVLEAAASACHASSQYPVVADPTVPHSRRA